LENYENLSEKVEFISRTVSEPSFLLHLSELIISFRVVVNAEKQNPAKAYNVYIQHQNLLKIALPTVDIFCKLGILPIYVTKAIQNAGNKALGRDDTIGITWERSKISIIPQRSPLQQRKFQYNSPKAKTNFAEDFLKKKPSYSKKKEKIESKDEEKEEENGLPTTPDVKSPRRRRK
jgi:hypothetical protein